MNNNNATSHTWRWLALGWAVVCSLAFGAGDPLRPRIPLPPETAAICPASFLRPFSLQKGCSGTPEAPILSGCDGVWIGVGCGEWSDEFSPIALTYYQYNFEHNRFYRDLSIDLYQEPFDLLDPKRIRDMFRISPQTEQVELDAEGRPMLADGYLEGGCGLAKRRQISITPISGANWKGWMWEQSFPATKQKLPERCELYTPKYRCVALVFGNDKVSAAFPTYCFLRKKVNNLDEDMSFDVFMDMVKTIRFKEGSVDR